MFSLSGLSGLTPVDTEIFVFSDSEMQGQVSFPGEELEKKLLPWSLTALRAPIALALNPELLHLGSDPPTPTAVTPGVTQLLISSAA